MLVVRCSALILSVNHLVLLTKKTETVTDFLDWVDQSLADAEDHLQVTTGVTGGYLHHARYATIRTCARMITEHALGGF